MRRRHHSDKNSRRCLLLRDAQSEGMDRTARRRVQDLANPKYVLRNWMSALAYERCGPLAALHSNVTNHLLLGLCRAAEHGDHSVIHELAALLERPYEEQSAQMQDKWYRSTPPWAQNLPGVAFMSCSS